jgi:predicted N-acetyltransferase YhbS
MIIIRPETPDDYTAIYEVNQLAFDGSDAEPQLVEAIRQSAEFIPELSLVAEENGRVVGHILFSPITGAMVLALHSSAMGWRSASASATASLLC